MGVRQIVNGVSKRGEAPLFYLPPLFIKERGIKGERFLLGVRLIVNDISL